MRRYVWLCLLNLLLACAPLLTNTGRNLEYEYALILSCLILIVLPSISLWQRSGYLTAAKSKGHAASAFEMLWILILGPTTLAVPGLVLFATGYCPCSGTGYSLWILLQTYPAWLLAQALSHGVIRGLVLGKPRINLAIGFYGLLTAAFLRVAWALWMNPQKRTVDLFLGFLHGPIYDEWIGLDHGIILARAAHSFLALALLGLAWMHRRFIPIAATIVAICMWGVLARYSANYASISIGKTSLDQLVPLTLTHPDVTLHFTERSTSIAPEVFRQAKFHVADLSRILNLRAPHVFIYLYPDASSKKFWFGGGATDVTDVRTPSVHITASAAWHPTLRHELVHALTSGFAYHGLGFHPNMGFTEGLAVALAPDRRPLSLDDSAASLFGSDRFPSISSLFSPLFWGVSGSRAYTISGSIIGYILSQHGVESLKRLYGGASWQEALGEDQRTTLNNWKANVLRKYDKDANALYAEALFRSPGVLHDHCPHSKADLRQSRESSVYARLRQPLGWQPKEDYWPWRLELDPLDRDALLAKWTQEIRQAATAIPIAAGRLKVWKQAVASAKHWPPKNLEDVEFALLEADLALYSDGREQSIKLLHGLRDEIAKNYVGNDLQRRIYARIMVEEQLDGSQTLAWRRYLAGWERNLPAGDPSSEPWILTYFRLRRAQESNLSPATISHFLRTPVPSALPPTFYAEWYEHLGQQLLNHERFSQANTAFQLGARHGGPATRPLFDEWSRYVDYVATMSKTK